MKNLLTLLTCGLILAGQAQLSITGAEYFIDTDPGVGNGIAIGITPGAEIEESFIVDLSGLEPGLHKIHIRTQNENGEWGLYTEEIFYTRDPIAHDIVAAEYTVDSEPGLGAGESVAVTTGLEVEESFTVPTDGLEEGFHVVKVRVQNAEGNWSLSARRLFVVMDLTTPNEVLDLEYFIDEDPGLGNATPLSFTPGFEVDETLTIPLPVDIPEGDHILYIRLRNSADTWSLYGRQDFVVDNSVGVDELDEFLEVYPNPAAEHLMINSSSRVTEIRILDMNGQVVHATIAPDQMVDLKSFSSGYYLIELTTEKGARTFKILKE
ncbi:MAG: T9SS type A sorting domain-containing protein [Flavobacteriales bacterium]|nr:T9SS type A sorting domain-containing protein [Flavobacteriales bacterium]